MEWKDSDLFTVEGINEISWSILDRRARPISDNTTDKEWRFRSLEGFIGEHENLRDVIQRDTKIVTDLGVTHEILAKHLSLILRTTEKLRKEKEFGPMRPIELSYCADEISEEAQPLLVTHQIFNGHQYSLFTNEDIESSYNTSWKEEYSIQNQKLKLEIKIAGNEKEGVIDFIRTFGFYESGVGNSYRVDPRVLWAILTGHCSPSLLDYLRIEEEFKLKELLDQMEQCEQLKLNGNESDQQWAKEMKPHFEKKLTDMRFQSQQFLSHLERFVKQ